MFMMKLKDNINSISKKVMPSAMLFTNVLSRICITKIVLQKNKKISYFGMKEKCQWAQGIVL